MKNYFKVFPALFFFYLFIQPVYGQDFVQDILAEIEYVQGQVLQLAEAMPEDKYSWRPGEGVRSVGEVFMHIGAGNYFSLSFVGGSLPEGFSEDTDKSKTKKSEIIEWLKESYTHVKNHISGLKEEDLNKPVDFFGNKSNGRRMVLLCLYHNHEHLGQAIAYARVNGIVPPWSQAQK